MKITGHIVVVRQGRRFIVANRILITLAPQLDLTGVKVSLWIVRPVFKGGFHMPQCRVELILGGQKISQIVIRFRMLSIDGQSFSVEANRLRQTPSRAEQNGEIVMRFIAVRIQREAKLVVLFGRLEIARPSVQRD